MCQEQGKEEREAEKDKSQLKEGEFGFDYCGITTIRSKLIDTYFSINPRVSSHPEQVMVHISPDFISISAEVPLGLMATCFG